MKKYFEKLGVKVLKTMAQSAVGVIGASTLITQVELESGCFNRSFIWSRLCAD